MIQTVRNLAADAIDAAGGKAASAAGNVASGATVAAGTKLAGPLGAAAAGAIAPTIGGAVANATGQVLDRVTSPVAAVLRGGVVEEVPSLNASTGTAVGRSANNYTAIPIESLPYYFDTGGLFNPIPNSAISDADRLRKLCELTDPANGGTQTGPHWTERTFTLRYGDQLRIINDSRDKPLGNVTVEYKRSGENEYSSFVTLRDRSDGCAIDGKFEDKWFTNRSRSPSDSDYPQTAAEVNRTFARRVDSARVLLDTIVDEFGKAS
ncbi:MAG: hypothetical protein QY326_03310 [Bdellovibrionota bacterium]|nr:MAG: hypothetical protein QY326_03310 [Bdellovibrionota bacterium]